MPLNKKILQEQTFKPSIKADEKTNTDAKPFNLKTDERSKSRRRLRRKKLSLSRLEKCQITNSLSPRRSQKRLNRCSSKNLISKPNKGKI